MDALAIAEVAQSIGAACWLSFTTIKFFAASSVVLEADMRS